MRLTKGACMLSTSHVSTLTVRFITFPSKVELYNFQSMLKNATNLNSDCASFTPTEQYSTLKKHFSLS